MRPKSMIAFDYAYLGSMVVGLIQLVSVWRETVAIETVARAIDALGPAFPILVYVVTFGFALLIWYFTSRRASVIARWILVIWTALLILPTLRSFTQISNFDLNLLLVLVVVILQMFALVMLFLPDSRAYFGEGNTAEPVA